MVGARRRDAPPPTWRDRRRRPIPPPIRPLHRPRRRAAAPSPPRLRPRGRRPSRQRRRRHTPRTRTPRRTADADPSSGDQRRTCTAIRRWCASTRATGACRPTSSRWPTSYSARATAHPPGLHLQADAPAQPVPLRDEGNDPQGWGWSLRYFTNGRPYYPRAYTNKDTAINSIWASIARTPPGRRDGLPEHTRGSCSATSSPYDRTEPSKKTLLGLYVSGPLGRRATAGRRSTSRSRSSASLHALPRVAAERDLGRRSGCPRRVTGRRCGPSSPALGARMAGACMPSSWPAGAGRDSTH